jgi:hypothetical protein
MSLHEIDFQRNIPVLHDDNSRNIPVLHDDNSRFSFLCYNFVQITLIEKNRTQSLTSEKLSMTFVFKGNDFDAL